MTLTAEYLREILAYDPITGILTWRWRSNRLPGWNTRYAGKPCGATIKDRGYIQINIDGRVYLAHRLAWLYMTGKWPDHEIDHRDRVTNHNWFTNLRPATDADTSRNSKTRRPKSGVRGVYFEPRTGRYYAQIKVGKGKTMALGTFDTIEEAREARNLAASKIHGEFAVYS